MATINEQNEAEAALSHYRAISVGTHTLSSYAILEMLYKAHEAGSRRGKHSPLASVEYALSRVRDVPGIEEGEKRELMKKLKEIGLI